MKNLDLIISGGGMKFYYLLGIKKAIQKLKKHINIKRYAGTSSGSIFATLIACNIDNKLLIETYQTLYKTSNYKMNIIDIFLNTVLPDNCHIICSNKVFLSVSKVGLPFKNEIISNFTSKKHLIEVIKTSSSFPFFVNSNLFYKYDNKNYVDGFFTNNTPFFKDNLCDQVIIRPFIVKYKNIQIFDMEPNENIQYLSLGFNDFIKFFNGKKVTPIEWYDPKKTKFNNIIIKYIKYLLKFNSIKYFLIIILIIIILKKMN